MDSSARQRIEELYLRYGAAVLRRARTILGNEAEAEDLLHDVFAKVMIKIESFRGESSVGTWLYQITTRACLDRLKVQKRRRELLAAHSSVETDSQEQRSAETAAFLREALGKLPEQLAEVAIYYYVDGLKHEEIAAVLGCSRRKVGYLLERFHKRAAKLVALPEGGG